jgi:hypothetical protein
MPEDTKAEIIKSLGLDRELPPGLGAGPISPDALRASLTGPTPEGTDALKDGILAFIYILAQVLSITPPFDERNELALDIQRDISKTIDINEAMLKAQTLGATIPGLMPGVPAGQTAPIPTPPIAPTPTGPTATAPTLTETPTPPTETETPTTLEGIEV